MTEICTGDYCYERVSATATKGECDDICARLTNGTSEYRLACLYTESEFDFATSNPLGGTGSAWIGHVHDGSAADYLCAAQPITYEPWATGRPDLAACVQVSANLELLYDEPCTDQLDCLCQIENFSS